MKKSPLLLILTIISWCCISTWSLIYFREAITDRCDIFTKIALYSLHTGWMIFWLWGIHNFWNQTFSLIPRKQVNYQVNPCNNASVAILYTTCDDFDPYACQSCLKQTHSNTRLVICDDSSEESEKRAIDNWARQNDPSIKIVRRPDRKGFKAGNLNYAIENFVTEEYVVVCDADEVIPFDFVDSLLPHFYNENIGFVQARHRSRAFPKTWFERVLGPSIDIFYEWCLPWRNRYGFVACFGHGFIMKRKVWKLVGGFPEIVSEDIGFAVRALAIGFQGIYTEDVVAEEATPSNYTAFVVKYRKIIGGTIEFFQKEFWQLAKSPKATYTEKLDLLITFGYCYIGPITMFNLLGGLALSHFYSLQGYRNLSPWLLLLYIIGPLTPVIPSILYLGRSPTKYGKYLLTSAIAYVSLLPALTMKSISQTLKLTKLVFEVTGKAGRERQYYKDHIDTVGCGFLIMIAAFCLPSPALPPAVAFSIMLILGPLLCYVDEKKSLGFLARNCVFVPYIALAWLILGV